MWAVVELSDRTRWIARTASGALAHLWGHGHAPTAAVATGMPDALVLAVALGRRPVGARRHDDDVQPG